MCAGRQKTDQKKRNIYLVYVSDINVNFFDKGTKMNWDQIEGNWKQLKGAAQQKWGKLTDDHLDMIAGKREQLAGKIQEVYGTAKDEVEKELTHWQSTLKHDDNNKDKNSNKKIRM